MLNSKNTLFSSFSNSKYNLNHTHPSGNINNAKYKKEKKSNNEALDPTIKLQGVGEGVKSSQSDKLLF